MRQEIARSKRAAQPLPLLVSNACEYMRKAQYDAETIALYRRTWKRLKRFAGNEKYSPRLGNRFVISEATELSPYCSHREEKKDLRQIRRAVEFLSEFFLYGKVQSAHQGKKVEGTEGLQALLRGYETYCAKYRQNNASTVQNKRRHAERFLQAVSGHIGSRLERLEAIHLSQFIQSHGNLQKTSLVAMVSDLRDFLRYLWIKGILPKDLSLAVPKIRCSLDAHVPTIWKDDQISRVLAAVDRGTLIGKRDYAILLLACQLGLRAKDIRELRLENLDWAESRISLIQSKTGAPLILPLLDEVGNALIDYLQFGRPKSQRREIFLQATPPHHPFRSSSSLTTIMNRYRKLAGLSVEEFGSGGMHSLRHTLATRMMERNVPLESISSILGHRSMESTRIYTKVNLPALRTVCLDPDRIPRKEDQNERA
jgi:site-specific recombinase XerD